MKTAPLIMFVLSLILTGCAQSPGSGLNKKAAGPTFLAQVASPGCLGAASINNTLTPPALYQGMVSCVKANNVSDGILLYAVAGSYSYFDALRLNSDQAREAHSSMLGEALGMLTPQQRQTFWQALNAKLSDKQQLAGVCRQVQAIGKPVYAPVYLMSVGGGSSETGAAEQPKLWNQALSGYLHCATDIVSIR